MRGSGLQFHAAGRACPRCSTQITSSAQVQAALDRSTGRATGLPPTRVASGPGRRHCWRSPPTTRTTRCWWVMQLLGLRRSEVCGLRWDNVDLDNRTLSVTHSVRRADSKLRELPTKTRRSTRTVPLPAVVHQALMSPRGHDADQPVLPRAGLRVRHHDRPPMTPQNLTRKWVTLAERHGIRKVPLHGPHHACASLLLAQGIRGPSWRSLDTARSR